MTKHQQIGQASREVSADLQALLVWVIACPLLQPQAARFPQECEFAAAYGSSFVFAKTEQYTKVWMATQM